VSNEVKIKITAENATVPVIAGLKAGIHDVETAADKAGNKLTTFGARTQSLKGDLTKLDAGIKESTKTLSQLYTALANTDDAARRIDIKKAISKVQSDLSASMKAHKFKVSELLNLDPDPAQGKSWAKKLMGSLASGLSSAGEGVASLAGNHVGLTIGAAAGAAAAPVLVSALGSALSAGVGLGVIGAGVMLAVKKDPELQAAGKQAGQRFMDGLSEQANKAFKGPILDSLKLLTAEGDKASAQLGKAFDALAPYVKPFTESLVKAADIIVTSLTGAAEKSGPALKGMGQALVLVSDGVGSFIDSVANGGPEAAQSLTLIAGATGDVLKQTGTFLGVLEKLSNNEFLTGPLLPLLKSHYDGVSSASNQFAKHTKDTADAMNEAATAAQMEGNALTNLADDMRAQTDPVFGLLDAEGKLAEAQAAAGKAAHDHGKNSKESDAALRDLAKAAIEVEGRAGDLAGTADGKLSPALKATLRAAGLTESQIRNLGGQFRNAKKDGENFAKTYKAKVEADTASAESRLKHVRDLLDKVHSKQISVSVLVADSQLNKVNNTLSRFGMAHGGIKGAANGATSSGLTWVGENGPELADLAPGTRVHSAGDSQRIANNGHGSGGDVNITVSLAPNANQEFAEAALKMLRFHVDRNGQGRVQNLLGRPGVPA
jgi:hypothetical protein